MSDFKDAIEEIDFEELIATLVYAKGKRALKALKRLRDLS
jgi:hypothetical protein